MGDDENDLWYQLGYALESIRLAPSEALERGTRATGRLARRARSASENPTPDGDTLLKALGAAGATTLGVQLLRPSSSRKRLGALGLVASGASGAAAAVVAELVAPLLSRRAQPSKDRTELGRSFLAGAGRGVIYGGLVRTRLPGPPVLLGLLFGTAEYLTAGRGGLARVLRRASPHRRIPLVSGLLEGEPDDDPDIAEHLVFGLSLAVLYELVRTNSGTVDDE